MTDLNATLNERGKRYGEFKDQAVYADKINAVFHTSPNWGKMQPDQREALRLTANKMARILNGDYDYADSWHDIAGYNTLIDQRLTKDAAKIQAEAPKQVYKDAAFTKARAILIEACGGVGRSDVCSRRFERAWVSRTNSPGWNYLLNVIDGLSFEDAVTRVAEYLVRHALV